MINETVGNVGWTAAALHPQTLWINKPQRVRSDVGVRVDAAT
jgi:hypothetical protein